ncbi:MAG: GAF domain-containing protein [Syntrophobacterales bacterium]|nr:MAG: GAF domain-containing protein [Syntrophobacterales bacterium]
MNILALPAALAFTMNITLCLIVLSSNPKNIANRLFACFVLSFVTWNVGEFIMINSENPENAVLGVKIIFAGLAYAPVFLLHFSLVFPLKQRIPFFRRNNLIILYLIPAVILALFFSFFAIDIQRLEQMKNVFYYALKFEEPLVFQIFILIIGCVASIYVYWGIRNLISALKITRLPKQKLQIKYLIFGIVSVGIVGAGINLSNHFLELGWPVFFLASLYAILVSVFFAIALIKYRLLDIHILIRGGILYSSLSGFVLAVYVLLIKNIGEMISQAYTPKSLFVESMLILVLVYMLRPFQKKAEDWIDRFFYVERYHYRRMFMEFSRALIELIDLEDVLRTTGRFISETLHIESIAILLLDGEGKGYVTRYAENLRGELKIRPNSSFTRYLKKSGKAAEIEDLRIEKGVEGEAEDMLSLGFSTVVPIMLKEKLMGLMVLGRKVNQKDYTNEEIEIMNAFSNQASLAISRALIYRDMSLKDRQIMQSEKMVSLGELAAGIAHEIRNPLAIISGSAETMKKRGDKETKEEMIDYITEEADRINAMVTNFLDFAKLKEPTLVSCNIEEVIRKTIRLISPQARAQNVKVVEEFPRKPLYIEIDPEMLQHAFMNIEMNALEAMGQGGILRINVLPNHGGKVLIKFSDTGKGVPLKISRKIFDPFFTTKEGGTGLGLSIAHTIVESHGGTLTNTSNEGMGTTFTISLPIRRK